LDLAVRRNAEVNTYAYVIIFLVKIIILYSQLSLKKKKRITPKSKIIYSRNLKKSGNEKFESHPKTIPQCHHTASTDAATVHTGKSRDTVPLCTWAFSITGSVSKWKQEEFHLLGNNAVQSVESQQRNREVHLYSLVHAVTQLVEALCYKQEGCGSNLDEVDFFN
jgi:hypothetical protein